MKFVLLITLLAIVSCGKKANNSSPIPPHVETKFTLTGEAGNDSRLTGVVLNIDLSKVNQEQHIHELLGTGVCNNALGNNNSVENTGVSDQSFKVISSNGGLSGQIHFGHLAYYSPQGNDPLCSLFTKEKFNFAFDGHSLTIFAIAPGKPWDGISNSFSK